MFILYDLVFLVFSIIYLALFLFKRKIHHGFLMRLGILPRDLKLDRPVWIHAVSVGEAISIRGLLEELRANLPNKRFVISTVTATGNKIAKSVAKKDDFVAYLPLDLSFIVNSVINRISPSLFIIAETEIWPNLIRCLYKKRIPIVVVNGRISDNSFRGYLSIKFLIKPILNRITLFCVQTALDAARLARLGVAKDKIQITGNMKFDLKPQALNFNMSGLRLKYHERLWVCGSTHPPEEEIILDIYKEVLEEFPDLRVLIAPRHPERTEEVVSLIKKLNFTPSRISLLESQGPGHADSQTVFILDTVGQLMHFYSIADIVFVGGSLVKKGGHNILEPAVLGKPIIFGPYMFNFRDIAELFLNNKGAILVHNQEELKDSVRYLLGNIYKINELSQHAKELMFSNQGATKRTLECIMGLVRK